MNKKSPLQSAIGAIEASKPIVLPRTQRTQTFASPSVTDSGKGEIDPWNSDATPKPVPLLERRTLQSELGESERKSNTLEDELPDNRDTENRHPDYQVTDFRSSDFQETHNQEPQNKDSEIENTDHQVTEKQPSENREVPANPAAGDSLLFGRTPEQGRLKSEEQLRKKKQKAVSLKRTTATKQQIAPFKNQKYSKPQIYTYLAEQDALELLRNPDPTQTLKGNEWPVFLFMLLKAFEWNPESRQRRDGKRNFATEFVAKGAGLSESTVFEVINRLIVKGFVKLVSAGARGNVYQVSPILAYRPDPSCPKKPLDDRRPSREVPHDGPLKPEDPGHRKSEGHIRKSENQPTENRNASTPKMSEPTHPKSETILNALNLLNSINLSLLENHFHEIYFSKIRAPRILEDEIEAFRSIVSRNGDLTVEVFQECFEVLRDRKDAKGNAIEKKFVWMAGGFDKILREANASLREKKRKAELSELPQNPTIPQPLPVNLTENSQNSSHQEEASRNAAKEKNAPLLAQANSLTEEISMLENRYTVKLEERDLAKMKSLRRQREELYLHNAETLDFSMSDLWETEQAQLVAVMNGISHLHREYPSLVALAINRLTAVKSEIDAKLKAHLEERDRIREQIHKSLGIKERPQLCRVAG